MSDIEHFAEDDMVLYFEEDEETPETPSSDMMADGFEIVDSDGDEDVEAISSDLESEGSDVRYVYALRV